MTEHISDDALDHHRTVEALVQALGAAQPSMFVIERKETAETMAQELARQDLVLAPMPPVVPLRADLERQVDSRLREQAAVSWFNGESS